MPDEAISRPSSFRKQRVRDDGVDRRRAGGSRAPWRRRSWCRPRRRYRRRSERGGRQCVTGSANSISTERSPRRVFLRNGMRQSEPAGEIADPGLAIPHQVRPRRSRDQDRFCAARPLSPAWPTDCRTAMPGNTALMSGVRCRCASTVMTRSTHRGEQRADDLLADRFAFVKSGVLPHVAEIRRDAGRGVLRLPRRSASAANSSAISFSFGRSSEA